MNGIVGIIPEKQSIRVNGLPRIAVDYSSTSTRGNIYIVTSQKNLAPAGSDPDIILRKSTDGGLNWSNGIRVNQDALNNGKFQFFPGITVDEFGGLNIIFYDDRNTTSDSSSVFLARSTDAGNTWNEYQINDMNFKPIAIGGLGQGYMGDNIDITSVGNKLFPVWMDNRTGNFQMWSVPIEFIPSNEDLPPTIIDPIMINEISSNSFTVNFSTVRSGNSKIKFGLTNLLEKDSILNYTPTTSHSLTVSDLEDSILITKAYELKQNYPNPFNPNTIIEFNLPVSSYVSLNIFDVTGKEVLLLINEFKEAGTHKLNFEAVKYNLSSGVYFYTLSANGFTQTKPMMLLK